MKASSSAHSVPTLSTAGCFRRKRVLVTSAVAGRETFVATNLAQAIACERDRKVLLMMETCEVRGTAHSVGAPVPLAPEYLANEVSEAEIIQHGQEGNLCFIPGGDERRE